MGQASASVNEQDVPYTTSLETFCVDLVRDIHFPPHDQVDTNLPYDVMPLAQALAATAGTSAANAGEIAYLYNHYGLNTSLGPTDSVGLQLAIWQLEYGSVDVPTGVFSPPGVTLAGVTASENNFLSLASGQNENAYYLNGLPSSEYPGGSQGLIATDLLNFTNTPQAATPTINTQQQPATATVGSSIADKATVSGGDSPTGTVTFNLYNNSAGTGTPLFTDANVPLSGGMATSTGYTATATGTDYWVATYNGDSNNSAVTSGTALEPVIISPATPAINTSQQPASATVGTSIADKATVTGGSNPTGTVTFNLFNNPNGTGTPLFTDANVPLVAGMATSTGFTATATGTDFWVATYNGDSNNNSVTSGTASEPVVITPVTPAINTSQQPATATVGSSVADKATVSGGDNPTGTVTFNLFNNSSGTGTALFTDTETLVGGMATSKGFIATATGTDFWVATYNGNANNVSVTSGTALEPVSITPAGPAINTSQQPASATVGTSIADKATVSGGYNPTGTVTFNLYNNANGTGTPLDTDANVPLVNGVATSAGYTATATGTDYWVATYNGDSNNAAVTSGTALEPVIVSPATPAINTTQQPATAIVGTSIADQATVSGGYNPTGTVTFNLYDNAAGTGTPLFTDANEPLVNGVATSAGYTATATGTDYWVATYNGDTNNRSVTSGTASEPVIITESGPAINTTQQPASATVGTSIADKATVTGGNNPTGTVTFTLFSNPNGTGTPLFTDANEPLTSGVAISKGFVATATGTDFWVATYNGDSNNNAVTSGPALEPVTITPATPAINTSQQPASATVGMSIADKATVTGGDNPTGTVTFNLYNNPNGTGTPLFTDANEPLVGGVATSKGYTATATGTDYWVATYNGDSNNSPVTSGTALEPVVITPVGTPDLAITKVPDQATVTAGTTIGFTITISNPGTATATGLMLTDPLPPGGNEFFNWTIDTTTGNPSDFVINGTPGSESLALSSSFLASPDSLAGGQSISVHITTPTTVGDVSGGAVGLQAGVSSSTYLGAAGNYGVLYIVGSSTHNLSITNVTLGANVGVGSSVGGNGVGNVTFSGPGIVTGRLDFAPGQTNQFSNGNNSNVGPASVNTNVAAVTSAISTVTSLNSSLGALTGTSITINGTQTINESAGTPHTVNGVTYSVFTVTSYSSGDGKLFTINGDGTGDPVVFNFGSSIGNVNLGGDVALTGNGLSDDKVIWNFTSSNQNLQLNNNASSYYAAAFHGIILAPNDGIHLVNANLSGRIFGGDNQDMQLVSGLTLHAPIMNTATVTAGSLTASASATITVTGSFLPSAHFAQLAMGSTNQAGAGLTELIGPPGSRQAGPITFAVDLPQGPQAPAVQAGIALAVSELNAEVAPLGLSLVQVSGADAGSAQVQIGFASTSAIGGVDQGVMGAYSTSGQITLINGWNWYFGSNPSGIAPDQYDFQTVMTHELGHVLGLGENSDPSSAMSLYLSPGEVRRDLTANDLGAIQEELPASPAPLAASPSTTASGDALAVAMASPSPVIATASGTGALGPAGPAAADLEGFSAVASSIALAPRALVVPGLEPLGDQEELPAGTLLLPAVPAARPPTVPCSSRPASPSPSVMARRHERPADTGPGGTRGRRPAKRHRRGQLDHAVLLAVGCARVGDRRGPGDDRPARRLRVDRAHLGAVRFLPCLPRPPDRASADSCPALSRPGRFCPRSAHAPTLAVPGGRRCPVTPL